MARRWHAAVVKAASGGATMAGRSGRRAFGRIRKLPSGRWQASYVAPDLQRFNAPMTFATKMDAEGWLGFEQHRITLGEWKRPAPSALEVKQTFASYSKTWLGTRPRSRVTSLFRGSG